MSARADQPPRIDTPREAATPGPTGGAFVLIGGACTPHGHALRSFVELTDAPAGGRIVGLTTASAEPEENAQYWTGAFHSVGAKNVAFPIFDRTIPEIDATVSSMIDEAAGLFLGGGDQVKLVTQLSGTQTSDAIHRLHRRGGTICGTSAGAAALTQLTMAG